MCIERPRVLRRLIKHSSSGKMFTDGEPELVGLEGRPVPGMKAGCWGQDGRSCGCPEVSKRKGGSLGVAVPSVSSVGRTGCLHVPSLRAQQGGGRRVRAWQCPGSREKCIVLYIRRLSQRVVDRRCWRRWDGQEPYSAGLVLRQVWGVSRKRMLEGCRWGGALSGPTPLVLQLGFPGAWADVWERERLECVGSLGLAGGTGGADGRTLGGGAAALAGERTWEG